MNKETRIQKIQEIIDNDEPFAKQEIPWKDDLIPMNVYKIPLSYLVYNPYNGRILSRTKSLEKQHQKIDVEKPEGKKLIEKLLWDSKKERNEKTLKNIQDNEQLKVGIITKDGIIIDGNRRVMLLNKLQKFDYFKAVVLPVTLEENKLEIEKLETSFQMGEDEKLGYNATEKYLKAKELYKSLSSIYSDEESVKRIADWMDENETVIRKYLSTMGLMDEYLDYLEYNGIYTQLDEREDQFLFLDKWLKTFYEKESEKGFDGYEASDVDDLKIIAFDYIRVRPNYDGKEFRILADGQKENHIFGDKEVWKSFSKKHFDKIVNVLEQIEIDYDSSDLKSHLDDRDKKFYESTKNEDGKSFFLENLDNHREKLGYNKASAKPEKLVKKATETLEAIKTGHSQFATPEVQEKLAELTKKVIGMSLKKSPLRVLNQIIEILEDIDIEKIPENEKEEVREKAKRINSLSYQLIKNV